MNRDAALLARLIQPQVWQTIAGTVGKKALRAYAPSAFVRLALVAEAVDQLMANLAEARRAERVARALPRSGQGVLEVRAAREPIKLLLGAWADKLRLEKSNERPRRRD